VVMSSSIQQQSILSRYCARSDGSAHYRRADLTQSSGAQSKAKGSRRAYDDDSILGYEPQSGSGT